jgi:hypothetical protein
VKLGRHGLIDVPVSLVIADAVQDAVAFEHVTDGWFHAGEPQGHVGLVSELEDLAHLR